MIERIKQVFPTVRKIALQLTFTDADQASDMSWREYALTPEAEYPIKIDCPERECIRGGFDLSSGLQQAVASRQPVGHGDLNCPGWQDRGKAGKQRCLVGLSYRMKIEYA